MTVESANNVDGMELCVNGSDAISVSKTNLNDVDTMKMVPNGISIKVYTLNCEVNILNNVANEDDNSDGIDVSKDGILNGMHVEDYRKKKNDSNNIGKSGGCCSCF